MQFAHSLSFRVSLFILFILVTEKLMAQVIETPYANEILVKEDSIQGINDDSLGLMNEAPLYLYFKKTLIYLNELDTVTHYTYIQRNYSDQFLRLYNDEKILPASLIHSVYRDRRYYRSVSLGNRYYCFAEEIEKGKMNLFCIDDILLYGELRTYTLDPKHSDYNNNLLILDANRRKNTSGNYLYFISFDYDKNKLIPIDAKTLADNYLRACPQSYKYLKSYEISSEEKGLKQFLAVNFVASSFIYFIAKDDANVAIAGVSPKHNYFGYYVFLSAGGFFTDYFILKSKKPKRMNIQKAVQLYNECMR